MFAQVLACMRRFTQVCACFSMFFVCSVLSRLTLVPKRSDPRVSLKGSKLDLLWQKNLGGAPLQNHFSYVLYMSEAQKNIGLVRFMWGKIGRERVLWLSPYYRVF